MPPEPPRRPSVVELSAVLRTRLANERTELAWWRTGLAAVAMALAVGRILPEIDESDLDWPYAALGAAFALYGIVLLIYGSGRARKTEAAIADGSYEGPPPSLSFSLMLAGGILLLATAVLITFD